LIKIKEGFYLIFIALLALLCLNTGRLIFMDNFQSHSTVVYDQAQEKLTYDMTLIKKSKNTTKKILIIVFF